MSNDLTDLIIRYEQDELDYDDVLRLFQLLVDSGLAWRLQGHYGRTANQLLGAGLLTAPWLREGVRA